jgi:hypothetical protein
MLRKGKRDASILFLLMLPALFLACASGGIKTQYIGPPEDPRSITPVAPSAVHIYASTAELDSLEFVQVALIDVRGKRSGWFGTTSRSQLFLDIISKAGELGCNGLIFPEFYQPEGDAELVASALYSVPRTYYAIAIRVTGRKTPIPPK